MIKSFFSTLLVFFCFIIFECAILSNIIMLPSVPDLMLLVLLFISLHNGCLLGESTGFFSGLMIDFMTAGPFGLNCLLRTLLGFIFGTLSSSINTDGFLLPAFLGFVATLLKYLLMFIISFFFPGCNIEFNIFSLPCGFEILANTLLCPLIFAFLRLFSAHLLVNNDKVN